MRKTMNLQGDWVDAHYVVQMKGTEFEIKHAREWHGRPWRDLRLCDTLEMAQAELKEWQKDKYHEYRIVPYKQKEEVR